MGRAGLVADLAGGGPQGTDGRAAEKPVKRDGKGGGFDGAATLSDLSSTGDGGLCSGVSSSRLGDRLTSSISVDIRWAVSSGDFAALSPLTCSFWYAASSSSLSGDAGGAALGVAASELEDVAGGLVSERVEEVGLGGLGPLAESWASSNVSWEISASYGHEVEDNCVICSPLHSLYCRHLTGLSPC